MVSFAVGVLRFGQSKQGGLSWLDKKTAEGLRSRI